MKYLRLVLISLVSLLLFGCTEDPLLTLKSGNNSIDVPADGGSASITITCNNAWSASANAAWIRISPTSGAAGDNNISITVSPNTEAVERQGVVTIQSEGLNINVNVKQAQANAIILSQKEVNISDEGGTFTVNVKSNVNYTVEISNGTGWLENIGSKALTSKDYTFSVKKNDSYDDRTAVITFKDASFGISESVTVHQAQKGTIILSKDSVQVPPEGGSIEVELKSSLDYKIEIISGSEWVKRTDTKALNTYKHTFSVSANESYDSRSSVVVFSSTSTNVTDTLTILQAHRNGLIVSEREKYLDANGGTIEVELQSNVDYNIVMPAGVTWLKRIDTKALETYKHSFSVDKNDTYDDRSTSVIFRSKDGALADTLFVTQRQLNALILTQKTFSLDDDAHDITVKIRSNIDYTVEVAAGVDWVNEVSTKALKEYTHTFHVASNPSHAIRSAAVYFKSDSPQLLDSLVIEQGLSGVENLSSSETANCYIVEKEGVYSFDATTIGNGNKGIMAGYGFHTSDATIVPAAAKLLWQDHEVVSNVTLQNGRVFFNASAVKGNAVIAVTDASGTILWSWHIWATDRPQEIRLTEATHAYLDRNLGATTVQLGLESTNGLYYQWGRKDPFRYQELVVAETPSPLRIEHLIQSPSTLFYSEDKRWVEYPSALWGNPDGPASTAAFKTIYDPCPEGYTIPSDDTWYEYDYEFHSRFDYLDYTHKYYSLYDPSIEKTYSSEGTIASKNGKSINYPLPGYILGPELVPTSHYFKNCMRDARHAIALYFVPNSYEGESRVEYLFSAYNSTYAVSATPIRCIKEEKTTAYSPAVTTNEASSVSVNHLVLNGVIDDTGNSPIKKYGFVWGNSQNSLNNEIESNDAHQNGFYQQFSYKLENLASHSVVYYRAFADNSAGRAYGDLKIARLKTATEYSIDVLDSLSRFMTHQYGAYGQGYNGEGTIRLYHGEIPGNSMAFNLTSWANLANSNSLSNPEANTASFPLYYYYRIINKVNTTLDNYVTLADDADSNIGHYKAALLGYRAYSYTMLAQLYCKSWDASGSGSSAGLPLRIHAADDVTAISTLAEVYQQIYSDLDEAISLMKDSGISRTEVNEIDLKTLYAIYARASLNRKDYTKAAEYARLARTGVSLMSNAEYNAGFYYSNSEWIWGAHPRNASPEGTLYYYAYFSYIGYNASSSHVRNYPKCISKELFEKIPDTDIRKKLFLNPSGYSYNTTTGEANGDLRNYGFNYARSDGRLGLYSTAKVFAYMQFKFAAAYYPGGGQQNFIRAAEMVLIEAEANYFIGNEGETRNLLNYLNKDSGRDASYNCTKSGSDLMSELKLYRRIELWGEGYDWFDLKRWGDPVSRKSFADGGNFPDAFAGTWTAAEKNDFAWVMPDDYETYIRNGSGI